MRKKQTQPAADVRIPIGELRADPKNARKHPEQNLALIERSLREHGAARSIAINEKNQLIAGHGVTAAAKRAGITHVRIVDADGDELIAVRRAGLSKRAQAELALLDNRTNETSEWDVDVLREMHDKGAVDLEAIFGTDALQELLGSFDIDPAATPTLRDGDRQPYQQMTFTLHDDQAADVRAAMEKAKQEGGGAAVHNDNSNGNALAFICDRFLRG